MTRKHKTHGKSTKDSTHRAAQQSPQTRKGSLSPHWTWKTSLAAALLVVMIVAAYLPATRCGYVWDDEQYVQSNQMLRSIDGLRQIWFSPKATPQYYPLVHTSFWLEYQLWKLKPAGYHIVNILLHALASVILWRLLVFLKIPAAWAAAALFALHPVQVESVAWITERKNVLSAVFYLAAALVYLRYVLTPKETSCRPREISLYLAALALFACALLSKTVTCTLPAVLLLVIWYKLGRISLKQVLNLTPFFAVAIFFGIVTIVLERTHVGAVGAHWQLSFIERALVAGRVVCFYIAKLFWPAKLTFTYPRWSIDASNLQQYLYPLGVITVIAGLWLLRRRIGKAPLVAMLCFVGTLFPALGFFDVYPMRFSFVADHFQYLAGIFIIVPVVAIASAALKRFGSWTGPAAIVSVLVILSVFAALTWRQCFAYENLETLWRDTIKKNPDAWMAHNNLGNILTARGQIDEAMTHYKEAIRVNENYPEAVNNLAWALATHPDPNVRDGNEAIRLARRAYQLNEGPNVYILDTLAAACAAAGQFDKAVKIGREALAAAGLAGDEKRTERINKRLRLYLQKKPYIIKTTTQN